MYDRTSGRGSEGETSIRTWVGPMSTAQKQKGRTYVVKRVIMGQYGKDVRPWGDIWSAQVRDDSDEGAVQSNAALH